MSFLWGSFINILLRRSKCDKHETGVSGMGLALRRKEKEFGKSGEDFCIRRTSRVKSGSLPWRRGRIPGGVDGASLRQVGGMRRYSCYKTGKNRTKAEKAFAYQNHCSPHAFKFPSTMPVFIRIDENKPDKWSEIILGTALFYNNCKNYAHRKHRKPQQIFFNVFCLANIKQPMNTNIASKRKTPVIAMQYETINAVHKHCSWSKADLNIRYSITVDVDEIRILKSIFSCTKISIVNMCEQSFFPNQRLWCFVDLCCVLNTRYSKQTSF